MRSTAGACVPRRVCFALLRRTWRRLLRDIMDWMWLRSASFCANTPIGSSHQITRSIPGHLKPRQNWSFCSHRPMAGLQHLLRSDRPWAMATASARRLYLVKINFIPAIRRTVAKKSDIIRTGKRLLPKCEPTAPPMIAAAARTRPSEGIE